MPWKESELQTLDVPIQYPFTKNLVWESNIAKFPNQMEMRVSLQTVPRYSYVARTLLDEASLEEVVQIFTNCKGMLTPLKWIVKNETKFVRFNSSILKIENASFNLYEVELNLIDVHPSEVIRGE